MKTFQKKVIRFSQFFRNITKSVFHPKKYQKLTEVEALFDTIKRFCESFKDSVYIGLLVFSKC